MKIDYPLSTKALAECEAYEEERFRKIIESIIDRTMSKKSYRKVTSWIRCICNKREHLYLLDAAHDS